MYRTQYYCPIIGNVECFAFVWYVSLCHYQYRFKSTSTYLNLDDICHLCIYFSVCVSDTQLSHWHSPSFSILFLWFLTFVVHGSCIAAGFWSVHSPLCVHRRKLEHHKIFYKLMAFSSRFSRYKTMFVSFLVLHHLSLSLILGRHVLFFFCSLWLRWTWFNTANDFYYHCGVCNHNCDMMWDATVNILLRVVELWPVTSDRSPYYDVPNCAKHYRIYS